MDKGRTKKIGLDFDGVIADTQPLKAAYALEIHGVVLDPKHAKESHVVANGSMTREQYRALAAHVTESDLGLTVPPVPGAIEKIKALKDEGHELSIITSRNEAGSDIARRWCEMQEIPLPVISVGYGMSKTDAAKGLDVYLDDDHEKLTPLTDVVESLCLFDAPHNNHIVPEGKITRVHSWDAFHKHVNKKL